eukprot:evm.model.scf_2526.1 EVM.evm.TU.scf_2526.1   scf_2526:2028-2849(+)
MAVDSQMGLEGLEGGDFDFPDFPDSLAALLMQDTCESLDLSDVLKDFAADDASAASPGEGSSVNNDPLSNVEADSAGEAPTEAGGQVAAWEAAARGQLAAAFRPDQAASSSGSGYGSELPGGLPEMRITTGIPGDSKALTPVRNGLAPVPGYQSLDTQGHPYPHPFYSPAQRAVPVAPRAEAADAAAARQCKRKKPDVDLSKIEDVEERRRQRRLAKNRNTAAVSRERKKAQLISLEERVKQLEMDNAGLKYWLAYRWAAETLAGPDGGRMLA